MILNRNNQMLTLNGQTYSLDQLRKFAAEVTEDTLPFVSDLYLFLLDWFSDSPFISVHTSGSTGAPKLITVRKDQMIQSARLTCEFLDLRQGDTALLCMPLQYIAGKMVVVRALVAQLNLLLRTPSGHPMADVDVPLRFAAMIPLQVYNTFRVPQEKARLAQTEILIIGGGAVDSALQAEIQSLPGAVYSTYGMTETLSHIALRRLNGPKASFHYHPFASVQLSLSADDTLVIQAPLVCDEVLITNDVACIHSDGTFTILGRKDNIINSGGIKVQTEILEEQLKSVIPFPFAITAIPDARLGEAIVLLLEGATDCEKFRQEISVLLPKYHCPRYIQTIETLPTTGNGKIDRAGCRALARKLILI